MYNKERKFSQGVTFSQKLALILRNLGSLFNLTIVSSLEGAGLDLRRIFTCRINLYYQGCYGSAYV